MIEYNYIKTVNETNVLFCGIISLDKYIGGITLKVNDMDKYELTEAIKKAKEILYRPETDFHFCGPYRDEVLEMVEEVTNPVTDKEGYVHKYYLTEDAKGFIELLLRHE